jgi:hypothetical protein
MLYLQLMGGRGVGRKKEGREIGGGEGEGKGGEEEEERERERGVD